jgi:hypothetical protein
MRKMKKTIAVVAALVLLLGATSVTFAQDKKHKATKAAKENVEIIKGKVLSVNQANKQITVRDDKTQGDRSFGVSEKAIAAVKVGDEVKIKVKSGNVNAESVMIVKSETKTK